MKSRKANRHMDEAVMTPDALSALANAGFSRRSFLKGTGALIVGFSAAGLTENLGSSSSSEALAATAAQVPGNQVDSWVAIAQDGNVTAYVGKCELGQGLFTVHHQLTADELYVPLSRVKVIQCDTSITPDQGTTSGSQSHPTQFGNAGLRQALATAREELFKRASTKLGVPVDQLTVKDGVISVKTDASKKVSYAELIGGQRFALTVNANAKFKDPKDYTVLGTSVPRYDIPAMVTGQYEWVQNVRLPGMLHGRVVRPPSVGATLISVDENSIKDIPGIVKVVVKNNFVGVVAEKQWQAIQASEKLKTSWTKATTALPKFSDYYSYLRSAGPTSDSYLTNTKDVDQVLSQAAKVLKATYYHPYQMHGSIGSSCAVADVKGNTATIWSPTQGVFPQRDSVALVLGLPPENVRVLWRLGSGCYGLNGADTVSYDAALLSQAVGRPVRVQLTRKDEMAWENYGPGYVIDEKVGLDAQGNIIAWDYEAWSSSLGNRPNATTPGNIVTGFLAGFPIPPLTPRSPAPDPTGTFGNGSNIASNYVKGCIASSCGGTGTIKSERFLSHTSRSFFWTGPLRSPARLQNTFAHESFLDEAAAYVKTDPLQYRLRHLADTRLIDVFNAAAKLANWDTRPSPKAGIPSTGIVTGRGIAGMFYEGNNGYGAMVAEVEVNQDTGVVRVKRFSVAAESGPVSNPNGFMNQNEGGTLPGMSRALMEEVTWDNEKITSFDWVSYPTYRFSDGIPVIQQTLINRLDVRQMGAGEVAITAVAAAIGNAIFDATGVRIRQLPFTPARVLAALKARGETEE